VTGLPLHLRPGAREWYAAWLAREHPKLVNRYRSLYRSGSYLPKEHQREIVARVSQAARRHGLVRAEPGEARSVPDHADPPPSPPVIEQLTLL
jgi:hypothetical protein